MSRQLRFSFPNQLKNFSSVLTKKEKFFLYIAILILTGSLVVWSLNYYIKSTEQIPAFGGEYVEGVIGQPTDINPLFIEENAVNSALCKLIFSSLMKYDSNGKLVLDIAEDYRIEDDGKKYVFTIKKGIKWHDGTELTARDVEFTINQIQNKLTRSSLRGKWQDTTLQVEDDYTISFQLKKAYAPFLNKVTFGILPKHVFEKIPGENIRLSEINLTPIGSGPFTFAHFEQDDQGNIISYQLLANEQYYEGSPYLKKVTFNFYSEEEDLYDAYVKKEINGFEALSYESIERFSQRKDTRIQAVNSPRYFAVFFNQTKSIPLADAEVRKALLHATDKKQIIDEVFQGFATAVNSPILPEFGEFSSSVGNLYDFDTAKAEEILEKAEWKKNDEGIRQKNDERLKITLITTSFPAYVKTAEILKNQWGKIGAEVEVSVLELIDAQNNYIKPREYQAVLFGQQYFGNDPDPYFFWHSSRKKDPGQNMSLYENESIDKLLEEAREKASLEERKQRYQEFENKLMEDAPALFICNPKTIYVMNSKVNGVGLTSIVNSSDRFTDSNSWFTKTIRERKTN